MGTSGVSNLQGAGRRRERRGLIFDWYQMGYQSRNDPDEHGSHPGTAASHQTIAAICISCMHTLYTYLMRILLTEGAGLTSRQVSTRLDHLGHDVSAAVSDPLCLARFTRHIRTLHRVPDFGPAPLVWFDGVLDVAARAHIDVIFPTQEQVTVTAQESLIDPEKTEQSEVVSKTLIENLPIIGRRWDNFVLLTPALPFVWVNPPTLAALAIMVAMGFFGALGHWLLILAHERAPASALTPFSYTQLLWMILSGLLVFGDRPSAAVLSGAGIVVGCGLYLIWRERARGK